jgi:iron complex outermembrane receptor protein
VNLITKQPTQERELSFMVNGTTARGLDLSGYYGEKFGKVGLTLFAASNTQREYDPNGNGFTAIPRFQRYTLNPKLYVYFTPTATLSVGLNTGFEDRKGGDIRAVRGEGNNLHQYVERDLSDRLSTQSQFDKRLGNSTFTLKNSISYFYRKITCLSTGLAESNGPVLAKLATCWPGKRANGLAG